MSYYYLTDGTGNVLGLVDDAGKRTHTYAYGPTGLARGTTTKAVPQPFRYARRLPRPHGPVQEGARYYDPQLGHFSRPAPSGQEKNAYLYADGDPVNQTDPTGLDSLTGAVAGAAVGAVASTLLDGVLGPVVGGALGCCAGGAVTPVIEGSSIGKACAVGAVTGAVSRGAGAGTKSLKAARTGS